MKETKKNNVVQETTVSYESRLQKNFFYYLKNQEYNPQIKKSTFIN